MVRITIETESGFTVDSLMGLANDLENDHLLDPLHDYTKAIISCDGKYTATIEPIKSKSINKK